MTNEFPNLSRREILGALGTIGAAGAFGGATVSQFSDTETFANNQLVAGSLDLVVGWEEHYSDWSEDEAEHASMENGELVIDDQAGFLAATLQEQFPTDGFPMDDPCATAPDNPERPIIELDDVKPGDFGEITFTILPCTNDAFLWMTGVLLEDSDNTQTNPESADPDETDGLASGELAETIRVSVWHDDDGDNLFDSNETAILGGNDDPTENPTLREALEILADGTGLALDSDPATEDRDCYAGNTLHHLGFEWEVPVDHANEIQSDSVAFDLGFYAEQCRHNTGCPCAEDEFIVEQSGITRCIVPVVREESAVDFYGYEGQASGYSSQLASDFPEEDTSLLFLYQEVGGPLSLFIHHDLEGSQTDGSARFEFDNLTTGQDWIVQDDSDPPVVDTFDSPPIQFAEWRWTTGTDGGVISPLPEDFEITITPEFGFDPDLDDSIATWKAFDGGPDSTVELQLDQPVTLKTCGADQP